MFMFVVSGMKDRNTVVLLSRFCSRSCERTFVKTQYTELYGDFTHSGVNKYAMINGKKCSAVEIAIYYRLYCYGCFRIEGRNEHFLTCSGCMTAKYCSGQCQKKDWKIHKLVCKEKKSEIKKIS